MLLSSPFALKEVGNCIENVELGKLWSAVVEEVKSPAISSYI